MSQIINRRDIDFLLYEVLDATRILNAERNADFDRESVSAIFDTAQALAEDKFLPFADELDANEPQFDGEKVVMMPQVKEALDALAENGFFMAGFDADVGGMQLPWIVKTIVDGMFTAANPSVASYAFLTGANANMLNAYGTQELKDIYLQPMLEGRFFGTMCLSETHAGSSLGDIRTKAEPRGDGSYKITGSKMWISGGDQEISENIVHMVLAKTPNGPAGVKGISLFLVPKYRMNEDGSIGEKNNIALAGLNHKMGHRGTTNCLLNFGETGESIGYLIGEEFNGLGNMFMMMNEARIGVGMGSVLSAQSGYLYALDYARNRPQGRSMTNRDPETPMINIIEHPDVKRLMMTQKAYVEGGYALIMYCTALIDEIKIAPEKAEEVELLLQILTPIAKSWPSEYCLEANKLAIQVLGGYGYTRDYPVERFYRDNRLNHIHEGTHAIHGIDILGRKVRMQNGAAYALLKQKIRETGEQAREFVNLAAYADKLDTALGHIDVATAAALNEKSPDLALANATIYLDGVGHAVVAWMWLQQAIAAEKGKTEATAPSEKDFYEGKLRATRFFFQYELPKVAPKMALVASLDDTCLGMTPTQFIGV